MIVSILIARPFDETFSYLCPSELEGQLEEGKLVLVPLGRAEVVGCIWSLDHALAQAQLSGRSARPISGILEGLPILPNNIRLLIEQLARYYHCPLGEALKLALPTISLQKGLTLTQLGRHIDYETWIKTLSVSTNLWDIFVVIRNLLKHRPMRTLDMPFTISKTEVQLLIDHQVLQNCRYPMIDAPKVLFSSLRDPIQLKNKLKSHILMSQIHHDCADQGPLPAHELQRKIDGLDSTSKFKKAVRGLIEARAINLELTMSLSSELTSTLSNTQPYVGVATDQRIALDQQNATIELTDEQQGAVQRILQTNGYEAFLLHGVTGSGKTEVYLEVIKVALQRGQDALVLVPEIGLTPQTIRRFEEKLKVPIYPWHSQLTPKQRLEIWCGLTTSGAKVMVGARSALFTPLSNIGVIVVDECHDASYKQGEGVRYHARDMAVLRAKYIKCPIILGSATPSLECIENARKGKYTLLQLSRRPFGVHLPQVHLIDLRQSQIVSEQAPAFSYPLAQAIRQRLLRGEQTILYLNRRGFSHSIRCIQCGFQFKCKNCDLTMPWHEKAQLLQCHHCEFKAQLPQACPDCHQGSYVPIGRGTERIEQQVSAIFPQARLCRLDRDSELNVLELEQRMRNQEIDILIGTQMVTKGHDFPMVTLVGILDADGALDLPDFRASERCYQLISQVSGRSGRADRPGEVLIQTYRPQDELLQAAKYHDFGRFEAYESMLRQTVGYPPFCYMIALRVEGIAGEMLDFALTMLSNALSKLPNSIKRLGPTLAPINQIRGKRRWIAILRDHERNKLHDALRIVLAQIEQNKWPSSIRLMIDVDPIDFL